MMLVDANLLIYSVNEDAPAHRGAKAWVESAMSGRETVALSWSVLLAFMRVTTRPGLFRRPLRTVEALDVAASWLEQVPVTVVHAGPRHISILRDLLVPSGTGGNLTSDAHLAALAIEHGAELCTTDRDFGRFPGLRWRNPIER